MDFLVPQQVVEMYVRVMVSVNAAAANVRVIRKGNTAKTVRSIAPMGSLFTVIISLHIGFLYQIVFYVLTDMP